MNKHNIILSILFLVIGFGAGFFYFKNFSNVNAVVENKEIKNSLENLSQDKFSVLFNSIKAGDKFIYPQIINNIEEDMGLFIIQYRNSPESTGNAVYDYKNDKLYKDIGYSGLGYSRTPVSFVDKNNVLVHTYDEGKETYTLNVLNFTNNNLRELPIKITPTDEVYGELTGSNVFISVRGKNGNFTRYQLDPNTLEIKK
ncbi:MAG: hypothetical protein QG566_197 [Patescibacteria group bacterium]|nr:hypothetical protein [Patescibacteria group bacterium]